MGVSELVETFVFAAPGRDEAHALCFESLHESDIGTRYTVCLHPESISAQQHWLETHERAAQSSAEYVLMLEDDCIVNEHILHNVATWRWRVHPRFGAGWLYNAGGSSKGRDAWYTGPKEWFGTVAVLYRTELMPQFIRDAWDRMQQRGIPWDYAISWAIQRHHQIRVHAPAIVEHLDQLPSKMGNKAGRAYRTTRDSFQDEWKRPYNCPNHIRHNR